jgi:hypothetical protein
MPLPEGYLPREGDVLVIHGTVKHDVDPGEKSVFVTFKKYGSAESVDLKNVVGLHCRRWDKGDKVTRLQPFIGTYTGWPAVGEVLAVHEETVWALFPGDNPQTFAANDLWPASEPETITEPIKPAPEFTGQNNPDPGDEEIK